MMGDREMQNYLDQFLSQGERSVYHPTFFLIEYDKQVKFEREKLKNQTRQILFTKEYLVAKIGNTVLFQKLNVIFRRNLQAYRELKDADLTPGEVIH